VVGLALAQRGEVPTRITSRASPDSIASRYVGGTVGSWTESGRRKQLCPGLFTVLGTC